MRPRICSPTAFPVDRDQRADRGAALTSLVGAYASYFLDGATGGVIVVLQTLIFLVAFFLAPKHGMLAARRRSAETLAGEN